MGVIKVYADDGVRTAQEIVCVNLLPPDATLEEVQDAAELPPAPVEEF